MSTNSKKAAAHNQNLKEKAILMSIKTKGHYQIVENLFRKYSCKDMLRIFETIKEDELINTNIPKRTIKRHKIAHYEFIFENQLIDFYIAKLKDKDKSPK